MFMIAPKNVGSAVLAHTISRARGSDPVVRGSASAQTAAARTLARSTRSAEIPAVRMRGAASAPTAADTVAATAGMPYADRSEEHTSELQSLMRNSYAVL